MVKIGLPFSLVKGVRKPEIQIAFLSIFEVEGFFKKGLTDFCLYNKQPDILFSKKELPKGIPGEVLEIQSSLH